MLFRSTGLLSQLQDSPGGFVVKDNAKAEPNCATCNGIGLTTDWYPINNLTEKPEPNVTNPLLCCNQQRKAIRRVLPTNTNLKKNYFQTTYMYLYNRCQTFDQRSFNFLNGIIDPKILELLKQYPFISAKIIEHAKPGSPLSIFNLYVAQCNPNFTIMQGAEVAWIALLKKNLQDAGFNVETDADTIPAFLEYVKTQIPQDLYNSMLNYLYLFSLDELTAQQKRCARVYYKPNNPQFAQQGGVSSSTRILKLNVDTISTAAAKSSTTMLKDKSPTCNPATYVGNPFFFQGQPQNPTICIGGFAPL